MRIIIVRHGDPDYAIDSLTEDGWKEAALLAQRLKKLSIKAYYSSPMGRAKATASILLKEQNREAEILPWLREFGPVIDRPGLKPGCAWDWLPQQWTPKRHFFDKDSWAEEECFQAGDLKKEYAWVAQGLDTLLERHGYRRKEGYYQVIFPNEDTIVLFCHFGVTCVMLSHLLGISPMVLWQGVCTAPSAVTILTTEERRKGIACFRMNCLGDTSHLYVADREPSFSARFCETFDNPNQRHD